MPKITKLSIQERNSERVNVFLDGEFAFGLSKIIAVELRRDQDLTQVEIENLQRRDGQEETRRKVTRLIGRRPRSIEEIRRYLRKRNTPEETAETVIEGLVSRGMLDDLKFAEAWIENRNTFRPRSAYALRSELLKRGVKRSTITLALEGFDERSAAEKAARIAARKYQSSDRRKRIVAYLARRGFPYSMVNAVVAELQAAAEQEESEAVD